MQQISQNTFSDKPPPYDAVQQTNEPGKSLIKHSGTDSADTHVNKSKVTPAEETAMSHEGHHVPVMFAGPSYIPQQHPSFSPTVYQYVNPTTGEHVTSLLPPDHPEMICLQQGRHVKETRYGLIGVLAAIFWFPLGIGLCLLDRRVRCARCGATTREGLCGGI